MKAEILAVGTELLLGDLVDTNAAWLGRRLTEAGFSVLRNVSVGDDVPVIAAAVTEALSGVETLLVTGGLGPTPDDLTREALARVAGVPLRRDERLVWDLRARYAALSRSMPERNLGQADLPEGATAIANPNGTAPGVRIELGGGVVYALPGVPHEMMAMVDRFVLPDLLARANLRLVTLTRTLRTAGRAESTVAEALSSLHIRLASAGSPVLSFLAGGGEVRVRLTATGVSRQEALAAIAPAESEVRAALGDSVYGADDDSLAAVVHRLLAERQATVATAESLTGGLLGATLTEVPGASATFRGGVTSYATELKTTLASVPPELLAAEGPVSVAVAAAMADGVRQRLGATYGLALTGVAGPEPQDGIPVGTVYVGLAAPDGAAHRALRLPGDRPRVRQYAVAAALDLLRRRLLATR